MIATIGAFLGKWALTKAIKTYWKPLLLGGLSLGVIVTVAVLTWRLHNAQEALAKADQATKDAREAAATYMLAHQESERSISDMRRHAEIREAQQFARVQESKHKERALNSVRKEIANVDPTDNPVAGPRVKLVLECLRDLGRHARPDGQGAVATCGGDKGRQPSR